MLILNSTFTLNYLKAKGSALISALFIMTLVAIAATAMSTRLQLDIYRTHLTIESNKLYLASEVVTFWAMSELSNTKNKFSQSDKQGKVLDLPIPLQTIYPGFTVKGSLYDLQGRFNINNIADRLFYPVFLRVLKNCLPNSSAIERDIIAHASLQWINSYSPGDVENDLESYYTAQSPPYFPSHQLMLNSSEFRLVKGVNARIYQLLTPYITALPITTPVNINTASEKVLMSLVEGLSEAKLNELLQARGEKGITNSKKLGSLLQKLNIRNELVTIESQFFMSMALINSNDVSLINFSLLKRSKQKNGTWAVSLISESLNSL